MSKRHIQNPFLYSGGSDTVWPSSAPCFSQSHSDRDGCTDLVTTELQWGKLPGKLPEKLYFCFLKLALISTVTDHF